jgi:hypothetical protein
MVLIPILCALLCGCSIMGRPMHGPYNVSTNDTYNGPTGPESTVLASNEFVVIKQVAMAKRPAAPKSLSVASAPMPPEPSTNVSKAVIHHVPPTTNTFYFAITAYTFDGLESPYSNEIRYDLVTPPYHSAILGWQLDTNPIVEGYYIYYGAASRTYTNQIDAGFTNQFQVTLIHTVIGFKKTLGITNPAPGFLTWKTNLDDKGKWIGTTNRSVTITNFMTPGKSQFFQGSNSTSSVRPNLTNSAWVPIWN